MISEYGFNKSNKLHRVIERLHRDGISALVHVAEGFEIGLIFIDRGHVVRCEWRGFQAEPALEHLLSASSPSIWIEKAPRNWPPLNILTPTIELLGAA